MSKFNPKLFPSLFALSTALLLSGCATANDTPAAQEPGIVSEDIDHMVEELNTQSDKFIEGDLTVTTESFQTIYNKAMEQFATNEDIDPDIFKTLKDYNVTTGENVSISNSEATVALHFEAPVEQDSTEAIKLVFTNSSSAWSVADVVIVEAGVEFSYDELMNELMGESTS